MAEHEYRNTPSTLTGAESESERPSTNVEARSSELVRSTPHIIAQAKLSVGPANDVYEREADAVADRVVRSLAAPTGETTAPDGPRAQRSATASSVSTSIAAGPRIGRVRRSATVGLDGGTLDSETEAEISSSRGGGRVMRAAARSTMEGAFGTDFGHVRIHEGSKASELNDRIQAKAFTVGSDIYFRDGAPDTSSREGQHLLAHELTHTIQQGSGVQREFDDGQGVDKASISMAGAASKLREHIGAKSRQQDLVTGGKHGQEMAEEVARGKDGSIGPHEADMFEQGPAPSPEKMSQTLMNLVALTKYDDTASKSVIDLAMGGKDLANKDMWNLIVVNSMMMTYIQPGMEINKIIPDSDVLNVLKIGQTNAQYGSTYVGGSVASAKNYGQGLTGAEAISNFGLDYAGYKEGTLKADGTTSAYDGKGPSGYVVAGAADEQGRTLKAKPNVFFMNFRLPEQKEEGVKVPVHGNVYGWAQEKMKELSVGLSPGTLEKLADAAGATPDQMRDKLAEKIEILTRFLANATVETGALTTLNADKTKNEEDPLTNLGMTKPSSRLQTPFGTINQEYYLKPGFLVPAGSGLYLKDSDGNDTLVGEMIKIKNTDNVAWGNLNRMLILDKITENKRAGRRKE